MTIRANRMLRVNELIQRELGNLIERDVRAYTRVMLTVTDVKTSPDLQHADVYVSAMGKDDAAKAEAFNVLRKCRKDFQHELGLRIKMKFTPVLRFHQDLLSEKADHVLMIMEQLHLHPETGGSDLPPESDTDTSPSR